TEAPAAEMTEDPDPVAEDAAQPEVLMLPAAVQEPTGSVTAPAGVNIRTGPGTNFSIIGVAPEGTQGTIVGVSEDGQWWVARVPNSPNGIGWVSTGHVEATNVDNVPTIPTPPVVEWVAPSIETPAEAEVQAPDELPADSVIVFSASRRLLDGNRAYELEDIYTVSPQPGSSPSLIIQNAMQPAYSADANVIAFRSTQSDQLGLSGWDFGADARVRYSNFVEDSRPSWSPTGDRFVFSSNRTGDRRWHVYLLPPTPGDDRQGFPEAQDLGFGKDADWHPSQDLIIYKGCDETGQNCGLWTMGIDGGGRTQVTDGFNDSLPRYSPDGQSVVFMSDSRDGNWELYTMSVADGSVTRITDNPASDGLPAWSPDGSRIAFMSNRDGAWGIWTVAAAGGDAQLVTQLEEQLPDWLIQGIDWPR
ncbi:MAG: SH3 domain-containing protein, partial [Caldilineaceae bacterium]